LEVCELLTIGIVGKTNTGKTTLFNAATLLNAKISTLPFTTKKPNVGVAYVCDVCICRELGVKDNPLNSSCIDGWRYVPVKIVDVPGLIRDAWLGRGLGNQFLSVIAQADSLIHVVDASGSIDAEGRITTPGSGNPVEDALDVEFELQRWLAEIILNNKLMVLREIASGSIVAEAIAKPLAGIKANAGAISQALELSGLKDTTFSDWTVDQTVKFSSFLLPLIKPTLIVANKMDIQTSENYLILLQEHFGRGFVAACSAEAELVLRRAEKMGLLHYTPGEEKFTIKPNATLSTAQKGALRYVETRVMDRWMRTGIQQALNTLVLKLMRMNMIYPVADESKFSDHHGNVLPDVYLLKDGSTPLDLARNVHTSLLENYILAIDAKTGIRLPSDYVLRHKDAIKIVTRPKARPKT
jgi:ribosome-binding ATPase YchF (GTP1/OBG family)